MRCQRRVIGPDAKLRRGELELLVDGGSGGTAIDTTTTTWDAISLVAGADGNVGAGGVYDDIVVEECSG